MQKIICSRATESGRISISDLKLITTSGRTKEQRIVTEDEFYSLLKSRFNISLQNKIKFPSH
jgi:arylamine N-acetyltransferase